MQAQPNNVKFPCVQGMLRLPDGRTIAPGAVTQTDFGYTGQRDVESLALMDYKARFYDPGLGRFTQADTIVPNAVDPQSWNRYTYVVNNPIRLSDPTGQRVACGVKGAACENEPMTRMKGHDRSREEDAGPMGPAAAGTATGGTSGLSDAMAKIESGLNWSLTTPGEMTVYQSPTYPDFYGVRIFYQPFFTHDNGSPVTMGPTSITAGAVSISMNGECRVKSGYNAMSALGFHTPDFLQPRAIKLSVDVTYNPGKVNFTSRTGMEIMARPDRVAPVAIGLAVWEAPEVIGPVLKQAAQFLQQTPCIPGASC